MRKSYRPGVYSQYDVISRQKNFAGKYAFFCGGAKVKEDKSLPAGGVVQLRSIEQLDEYFEEQGTGRVFCEVCRILLQSGIEGLYVVPVTTDGSEPESGLYSAAIQKLCEVKRRGVILCASSDQSVLEVLRDQVQLASENERERLAIGAVEKESAAQVAQALNSERFVLCAQQAAVQADGEGSVLMSAAAVAAMLAVCEPAQSLHGQALEALADVEALEEEEVETLLGAGVTVLEQNEGGAVECIRCVTTRTATGGEEDRTFAPVNVVLMIDNIIQSVRQRLTGMIKGAMTGFSEDSIATQVTVILDEKKQEGLIRDFQPPVVYREEEDPSVCVVELEFGLTAVLSQIYLTAHISV